MSFNSVFQKSCLSSDSEKVNENFNVHPFFRRQMGQEGGDKSLQWILVYQNWENGVAGEKIVVLKKFNSNKPTLWGKIEFHHPLFATRSGEHRLR